MTRLDFLPTKELMQAYRNVFSSRSASVVIAHMMWELGVFQDMPNITPEDVALRNYGSRLLRILGGGEVKGETLDVFVKRLISQPLEKEQKED